MKNIFLLIFSCLLVINTGCNFHSEQENRQTTNLEWSTLIIESENSTNIIIDNYDDTVKVIASPVFDIFIPPTKRSHKIDTIKAYFTMAEKESIFKLSKDIISNPIKLNGGCTEFVGDLKITIYYGINNSPGSVSQSTAIEYSGVCNWNTLSDKTIHLHEILKRKLSKVYLGENDAGRSHVSN